MYSAGLSATPKASPAHRKWVAAISLMPTLAPTMPAPRQACRGQTMPSANELRKPRTGPARRSGRRATRPAIHPPPRPARRFQKANPANRAAKPDEAARAAGDQAQADAAAGIGKGGEAEGSRDEAAEDDAVDEAVDGRGRQDRPHAQLFQASDQPRTH